MSINISNWDRCSYWYITL